MWAKAKRLGFFLYRGRFIKAMRGLMPPLNHRRGAYGCRSRERSGGVGAGVWISMYGIAVLAGGLFLVRPVRIMGLAFAVLGALAMMARGVPPYL